MGSKPEMRVLVDQSVLTRAVGGPTVINGQLAHLGSVDWSPDMNVRVRVLIGGSAVCPGVGSTFTVFGMREPYPVVALEEHVAGRLLVEGDAAGGYVSVFDRLWDTAVVEDDARELIFEAAASFALRA
jgi:hypothetical protein